MPDDPEDNVVDFPGSTTLDLDPDDVLRSALAKLDGVVILGVDKDGDYYFASSLGNTREVLWMVEQFKRFLLGDLR